MAYIVTLTAFSPPARADGVPFTKARVEEAALALGPFTTIDTLTLAPVDADPEHPYTRDLTTKLATLTEGFYRVSWIDGSSATSVPSAPVQNLNELAGGIRPTIAAVASLLRARTKERGGGVEAGTFNANTRPTNDEVDGLVDEALAEVLGRVRAPTILGGEYEKRVRGAVALYTAILVELSYFPEQVGSGKSPADTYQKLYDKRMAALETEDQTGEVHGEDGAGSGDSTPADAAWSFPDGSNLLGWNTRF